MSSWGEVEVAETARRMDAGEPLSLEQAAWVLNLRVLRGDRRGCPSSEQVKTLVGSGRLRVIDPWQPTRRWTVAPAELRRYISGAPMRQPLHLVEPEVDAVPATEVAS